MNPEFEPVFADTNVWVYQYDARDPKKRDTARRLLLALNEEGKLTASLQTARELVSALRSSRAGRVAVSEQAAWEIVENTVLPRIRHVETAETHAVAHRLRDRYALSVYDSFIVAAAIKAGCRTIYSEDLQHGATYETVTVVDPFREDA